MEKKKNKKNDKWEKAKPILLKILHGVSYVFSAIFIGLCVYACASSGSKKDNQKPIKQQHNEVVYVDKYIIEDGQGNDLEFYGTYSNDVLYDCVYTSYKRLGFEIGYEYILSLELYQNDDYYQFSIYGFDIQGYELNDSELNFYTTENQSTWLTYYVDINKWSYSPNIDYFGDSNYVFRIFMYSLQEVELSYPICLSNFELVYQGQGDYDDYFYSDIEIYSYFINYDNDTLFGGLTNSTSSFIGTLNSGLTDMISIFYDDGITTIGTISLIVVAVSLVWLSFRLISSKVRLR